MRHGIDHVVGALQEYIAEGQGLCLRMEEMSELEGRFRIVRWNQAARDLIGASDAYVEQAKAQAAAAAACTASAEPTDLGTGPFHQLPLVRATDQRSS